jgi:putative peptide zinc metalloprotease protein
MSLLVNLNPLMRFDGYFFLSDMLNMPNLQDRSFRLAKWQLRTWLFGRLVEVPENFARRLHAILVTYAMSVWIYRLILFLGIALLVYHMFFKALGIFLFCVEIWYFIARPIYNELKAWPQVWKVASLQRRRGWYLAGGGLVLLLLFPWRQDFVVQGQWSDARYERIYPVRGGRVDELLVAPGQRVEAGQVLVRLSSPELDYQLRVAVQDVLRLRSQLERSLTDKELSAGRLVLSQALLRAQAEQAALERVREQLVVTAPVAGRVEDLLRDLHVGRWVSSTQQLFMVREGAAAHISALVPESKLDGLEAGSEALFYAETGGSPQGVPLEVSAIERSAVKTLDSPYFAVDFGGDIPVSRQRDGEGFVPEISVYRVHLRPADEALADGLPDRRLRGWVHFEGERRTLLGRALRYVLGVLIRESGF